MELKDLEGKKSYLVAVAAAMYALGGFVAGFHDLNYAITVLLGAGGLSAVAAKINRFFDSFNLSVFPQVQTQTSTGH